jgi:hypothetical protein
LWDSSSDVWKALLKAWYFNGIPSSKRGIEDTAYVFVVRMDPIKADCVSEEVSPSVLIQYTKTWLARAFRKKVQEVKVSIEQE